jgi:trehalose/maltose hydrolase-like predicted phosphorylase
VLRFQPRLLDRLEGLRFSMQFRGTSLRVHLSGGKLTVLSDAEGFSRPVRVGVGDEIRELGTGEQWTFMLQPESLPAEEPIGAAVAADGGRSARGRRGV